MQDDQRIKGAYRIDCSVLKYNVNEPLKTFVYITFSSKQEHITTHTGEYLYNCAYCPQKFKSHSGLYQHYKRCHQAEWKADRPMNPRPNKKID